MRKAFYIILSISIILVGLGYAASRPAGFTATQWRVIQKYLGLTEDSCNQFTVDTTGTILQGRAVDTTTPSDSQYLIWDSTNSFWTPSDVAGGVTASQVGDSCDSARSHAADSARAIVEDSLDNYTLLTDFAKVVDDTIDWNTASDKTDGTVTQWITKAMIDSTSNDIVVSGAYKVTSAEADSQYITKGYADGLGGGSCMWNDSIPPVRDSLDSALARIAVLEAEIDTLDVHREVKWVDVYADQDSIDTYLPGWWLCDGNNGTPNLLGRFIVGAGGDYAQADTGGVDSIDHAHTHSITTSGTHTHGLSGLSVDSTVRYPGMGTKIYVTGIPAPGGTPTMPSTDADGDHDHNSPTGSTLGYEDNRPQFYGLTPVMRKKYGS